MRLLNNLLISNHVVVLSFVLPHSFDSITNTCTSTIEIETIDLFTADKITVYMYKELSKILVCL